jgi:hypothetical protein
VGKIDINQRRAGTKLDPLHSPRHIGMRQTRGRTFQISTDRVNHCQRRQGIPDVEITGESQAEIDHTTAQIGANVSSSIGLGLVRQRPAGCVAVNTHRSEADASVSANALDRRR